MPQHTQKLKHRWHPAQPGNVIAVLAFLLLFLLSLLIWWIVDQQVKQRIQRQPQLAAQQAVLRLKDFVNTRLSVLEGIARERQAGLLPDRTTFETISNLRQAKFTGFQAINWIDALGIIRWVAPHAGNATAIGRSVYDHPLAAATARKALDTRQPQMTGPLQLFQGESGIATYFPVTRKDRFDGFVNGVFRTHDLIQTALQEGILDQYSVRISEPEGVLYQSQNFGIDSKNVRVVTAFKLLGHTWQLELSPGTLLWQDLSITNHHYVFGLGILVAASIALLLRKLLLGNENTRKIEQHRLQLAALTDSSMDLVSMVDSQAKLTYLNPMGYDLLGLDRIPIEQIDINQLVPEEELEAGRAAFRSIIRDGQWEGELRYLHQRERTTFPLYVKAFRILEPESGQLIGIGTIARDMRRQHQLQSELQHALKMESIGRLAGGIAHDFNNLLTAMMAYAELIEADASLTRSQAQYLNGLNIAMKKLAELTRNLLQFSHRTERQPEVLDLSEVLQAMTALLRRLVREDIELSLEIAEGVTTAYLDRSSFEQAVSHLVINSVDAFDSRGEIQVALYQVGDWLVVQVKDNGAGMSKQQSQKAPEPFYTTKEVGKGTGLGLSSVYGFARAAGGRLEISSQPGQGTTVELWLPRTTEQTEFEQSTPGQPVLLKDKHVLLVEDEASLRLATARMLTILGCRVTESCDGQDGLEKSAVSTFDLIVSDVIMPRKGGMEFVSDMRQRGITTPVILSTGYNPDGITHKQLSQLGCLLMDKPYTLSELEAALQRALALRPPSIHGRDNRL